MPLFKPKKTNDDDGLKHADDNTVHQGEAEKHLDAFGKFMAVSCTTIFADTYFP